MSRSFWTFVDLSPDKDLVGLSPKILNRYRVWWDRPSSDGLKSKLEFVAGIWSTIRFRQMICKISRNSISHAIDTIVNIVHHHLYSYYNIFPSALWSGKDESRWGTSCRTRATALPLEEKSFCFYMLCSCIYVYICVCICACALYLCLHLCHYFTCPVSGKEIEEPVAEEGQRPLSLAFQFEPTPLLSATFFSGSSFLALITAFFL